MNEKYSSFMLLCVSTYACLILLHVWRDHPDQGYTGWCHFCYATSMHELKTCPVTSVDP